MQAGGAKPPTHATFKLHLESNHRKLQQGFDRKVSSVRLPAYATPSASHPSQQKPPRALYRAQIRSLLAGIAILCASTGCSPLLGPTAPKQTSPTPSFLKKTHQLSFAGRRSGEGYFSPDARKLIFQSEREADNPFFQIYSLDLRNGDQQRLSTGRGQATHGFFHPSGARALFSATHLDPDALKKQRQQVEDRTTGHSRRYAWDYDPQYEIFSVTLENPTAADPTRLTDAPGYDAEASWSPDGRTIVFASNRHAYAEGSTIQADELARDPAYAIDLYVMDASGQNVRRLTNTPGYDGGPFFSPDGTRIVWRRFSEDGQTAEIYTMRADGTEARPITRLDAMSWAPFYHPSGDYVIFTTNRHGHANFELYIVDSEGLQEPVRVTDHPGFDGIPVFSPDGKQLVWTHGRTASGQSQLFRGEWNDEEARRALDLPHRNTRIAQALLPIPAQTDPAIREADLRAHVEALASDITEGRLTGTSGEKIATSYVARVFRSIGLDPAGDDGRFFQNFGFTAGVSLGPGNALILENAAAEPISMQEFKVDTDWRPFAFSAEGAVPASEVVYAGYGIVAPATEGQRAIDSYADLDVENRWVLVFRYVPEQLSPESRQHLHRYSSLRHKAMVARDRGARGLLVVSGPNSEVREELAPLRFDVSLSGSGIAAISISDALAEELLKPTNRTLQSLQDQADANSAQSGFKVVDTRVAAEIALKRLRQTGRNVIGRLKVGPEISQDVVIVGAHVDHLGRGSGSGSLARPSEKGSIHPGADDNASGVAALIEVAELLAARRDAGELGARRDIIFAAWSGEELGLLGSTHWTNQEAKAQTNAHSGHGSLAGRVSAYLNFDMVGRLEEKPLSLFGVASSPLWPRIIERENIAIGLPIDPQEDSYLPTDATAFYTRRVPILAAFTGSHGEYHTPRDTPDKLDYSGAESIAQLMAGIAQELASQDTPPEYVAVAPDPRAAGSPGVMRVYLGTIPDYAQSDQPGVLLSAVAPGGPAEKAGLRGGDTIISVAGKKIENIYDYTYALDALKVGTPVKIRVVRDGDSLEREITPGSRE